MKKLYKLLTAILAIITVFSLMASCGGTLEETTLAETTKEATPIETTPENTPAESTSALTTPESTPAESTSALTTPESTPAESTSALTTPESTPVETTPAPGEQFNISYDLDGGFVEGNPLVYNNADNTKIAIPVKIGYDFVGWTGTGIDTPTVSLTLAKGTEGDIALKANWVENGEFELKLTKDTDDVFGKILFGKATGAIVINTESSFCGMDSVNASNELVAMALQSYIEKNKQIIKIVRDEHLANVTAKHDFRFYFGVSDCEPTLEFVSTLNYAQYGVAVKEDSLTFISWTEAATEENGKILYEIIEHVVKGGRISDFAGGRYVGTVEGTVGKELPQIPGLDGGADVGEGAYLLYSLDSTKEIYDGYLASLEVAGYTLHTTNVMNKTHSATYYNGDTVVNVLFAGGDANGTQGKDTDKSLRVVVEPLSITALPATEKPADADEKVAVSSFTQLSPHNLCMVVQLSNGHFIVYDSGNNGTQNGISKFLRSKAPDPNNVIVEAWIFSHFHQDHIGGFIDYMSVSTLSRYITVESVIYNFPSTRTYMTAENSGADMNNMKLWYEKTIPTLREKGTTVYQARTGQKYYFGNAELEILWTFEDLQPFNIFTDKTNRTSIGFSLTIEGQKFLLTGDTTEEEFKVAEVRYGDYLKSDFLQLAHHGTGNALGSHNVYTIANAPVIFFPYPGSALPSWQDKEEIAALHEAELIIRTGNYGTATLTLPFKIGDPIESELTPKDEPLPAPK